MFDINFDIQIANQHFPWKSIDICLEIIGFKIFQYKFCKTDEYHFVFLIQ